MKLKTLKSFLFLFIISLSLLISRGCSKNETLVEFFSPDKNIRVHVINTSDQGLFYKVDYLKANGWVNALDTSSLGIILDDIDLCRNLKLESRKISVKDEVISSICGKRIVDTARYTESSLQFGSTGEFDIRLVFRAYNDGIAYRYQVSGNDSSIHKVSDELSSFNTGTKAKAWMQTYDTLLHWSLGYEIPYQREIPAGTSAEVSYGWALPLLFEKENGIWMLVSEADLDENYCGMHVKKDAPGGNYSLEFPGDYECYGEFDSHPSATLPWTMPWRFVILSDQPGDIVESNMVNRLSRPSEYQNTGWIKPGRASWSWWSDPQSSSDYIPLKDHVDLSAEMGWEYSLVDADWDIMVNGNIDQLISYSHTKDVGLFIWYNSGGPNNRVSYRFNLSPDSLRSLKERGVPGSVLRKLEPVINRDFFPEKEYRERISTLFGSEDFRKYGEQIIKSATFRNARPRDRFYAEEARIKEFKELRERGVKGIKVDFFASDKQEIIKLYLNIFKEAAKNGILINTHGSTIPRGWSRTYPNLLTMEAVMGAEMYGSRSWPELAPVQNTLYPFIRNVVGPMDYTPATFSIRKGGFPKITTDAHELALTVLYETGLLHISENASYLRKMDKQLIEFLKNVPVCWDDTWFIDGYPGEFCILARKSGNEYYISGINGTEETRQTEINLSFLVPGNYKSLIFEDIKDTQIFRVAEGQMEPGQSIPVSMDSYGGFVIRLKKE